MRNIQSRLRYVSEENDSEARAAMDSCHHCLSVPMCCVLLGRPMKSLGHRAPKFQDTARHLRPMVLLG